MFFINRISYLLFNFTYVECSYLVANNLITKGTAFIRERGIFVTTQHPYWTLSTTIENTLNRKASKYESGFDSQWSLFRRAMKAAS